MKKLNLLKKWDSLSPYRKLIFSFLVAIFVGVILLKLPFSLKENQNIHLPLGDRDRPSAMRMRDGNMRQQLGMFLEKLRVVLQITQNLLRLHGSISPVKNDGAGRR